MIGEIAAKIDSTPIAEPLGFISMDVDFYSSTVDALRILTRADVRRLSRVAMYFDDVSAHYNHRFGGELLAIEEFNEASSHVKIDPWRGASRRAPLSEASWLDAMYSGARLRCDQRGAPDSARRADALADRHTRRGRGRRTGHRATAATTARGALHTDRADLRDLEVVIPLLPLRTAAIGIVRPVLEPDRADTTVAAVLAPVDVRVAGPQCRRAAARGSG